jgi:hypothetical protein
MLEIESETMLEIESETMVTKLKQIIMAKTAIPVKNQILNKIDDASQNIFELKWSEFTYGYQPLHEAATINNIEAIKLWIAFGINVNVRNNYGKTPLMCASYGLNLCSVKELLQCKANATLVDLKNNNALHYCALTYKSSVYDSTKYSVDIIILLLRAGCVLDLINNDGNSAYDLLTPSVKNHLLFRLSHLSQLPCS